VQCYPPPGLYKLLLCYAESHGMGTSEAAVHMMRSFFQSPSNLPPATQTTAGEMQNGSKKASQPFPHN